MEVDEKEEEKEEVPEVATVSEKKPVPVDLGEDELKKLAGRNCLKLQVPTLPRPPKNFLLLFRFYISDVFLLSHILQARL